jgi:transposase InsO family protein
LNPSKAGSREFEQACRRLGVTRSRGAVGTSADNALAESFTATLKRETLQGSHRRPDARTARLAVFRWITRYNTVRRHSRLGQMSPIDYAERADNLKAAA